MYVVRHCSKEIFQGRMKVISHWYDIAKFILTQIPIVPRDMLWMFVLNVAEGKWLCAPHAPLKFDKLLFPSFTNGNYVSSLSSTTKVSSWTETFCLESFLTVRRKWLTLYSLYSSELLTSGLLHSLWRQLMSLINLSCGPTHSAFR